MTPENASIRETVPFVVPWPGGYADSLEKTALTPGPHDFTVRTSSVVAQKRLTSHGHRIPAPRIVTIARTPLRIEAGWHG
ncbi:hypothetical protein BRAS3843_770018 [Bradyrhizobium sp. STM 3843]|nr:hypothetical protein BRAS3843_770018 [Bradyrhizobium sp. STM 3843]